MANRINSHEKNLKMVQMSMIMAIMAVLQIVGASLVRVGITVPALVLIPIFIGSAAFGKKSGAILGGFFGIITLILGITGFDAYTNGLFLLKPLATVVICMGKGILAGLLSALVYEGMMKATKNKIIPSAIIASVITPLANTGLYILGVYLFFKEASGFEANASFGVVIIGVFVAVMANFIIEVGINVVCCPILLKVLSKNKMYSKLLIK